ncbi:MAG: peptidylprolyl isomerase, partial [Sphingomonadales bacterium]
MSETPPKLNKKFFIFAGLATVVALIIFTFLERPFMTKSCDEYDIANLSDPENTILMEVSSGGCIVIETRPDKAPNHVARFKELTREGFYDGIVFHRVIDGFMAQTGDPTGTGSGGSGQNIGAEFSDIAHERGTVSTARSGHPDSADSQFFIMFDTSPHLDGQYTVWGRVIEGMEYVDGIQKGNVNDGGAVPKDQQDKI